MTFPNFARLLDAPYSSKFGYFNPFINLDFLTFLTILLLDIESHVVSKNSIYWLQIWPRGVAGGT